jgi:hypothetical protein
MTSLHAYRKVIDSVTTHTLRLPEPATQGAQTGQELATLADGRTVVVIYPGYTLGTDQPMPIKASIEALPNPLPDDLRAAIKAASPHVRLINDRVRAKIAQRYTLEDEIGLLRTAPSNEMAAYNLYVQECRATGQAEKLKLGL